MQTMTLKTYKNASVVNTAETIYPNGANIGIVTICRFFPATDGPYGTEIGSGEYNDGYVFIFNISDIQYWKIVWFDVRSNKIYIKTKILGTIGDWFEIVPT